MMMTMNDAMLLAILLAVVLLPYSYIIVSIGAKAWFDRKRWHNNQMMQQLRGEDCDAP